ncbi:hypothetical protein EVAR_67782_1 [Eumeta japonica]|uniref:Uncharacterized protein n=1 Tax=Eumeta variegata TaxID=151549 RepID=A0A4C1ZYD5_EUMVA|nr:hypothetical protein EVAR_67782_1 [Eumeta japonica]
MTFFNALSYVSAFSLLPLLLKRELKRGRTAAPRPRLPPAAHRPNADSFLQTSPEAVPAVKKHFLFIFHNIGEWKNIRVPEGLREAFPP